MYSSLGNLEAAVGVCMQGQGSGAGVLVWAVRSGQGHAEGFGFGLLAAASLHGVYGRAVCMLSKHFCTAHARAGSWTTQGLDVGKQSCAGWIFFTGNVRHCLVRGGRAHSFTPCSAKLLKSALMAYLAEQLAEGVLPLSKGLVVEPATAGDAPRVPASSIADLKLLGAPSSWT